MNTAEAGELYEMAQEMRVSYHRGVENDPQPNGQLLVWAERLEKLAGRTPQPTLRQILEKLREQQRS